MAKNRSKRLRKKLYVDEFAVHGFEFSCQVAVNDVMDYSTLIDDFIDFIESRDLIMGGGANQHSFDCFVLADGRYDSVTEDDRQAITDWLEQRSECSEVKIGPLVDANGVD